MNQLECPQCASHDVHEDESIGVATCGMCGYINHTQAFEVSSDLESLMDALFEENLEGWDGYYVS